MQLSRYLLLFFTVLMLSALPAKAAEIYEVVGIKVEQEGEDAETAKNLAVADGEKQAFDELVKRFTDYGYIDNAPKASAAQISNSVRQMQITDEIATSKKYKAKLDFTFDSVKISKLLNLKLVAGQPVRDKFLLIPISSGTEGLSVWKSLWFEVWNSYRRDNIIIPVGDLDDIRALKISDLEAGIYTGLDELSRRYKSPIILLVEASYVNSLNELSVKVEKLVGQNKEIYEFKYPGGFGVGMAELYITAANDISFKIEKKQLTRENAKNITRDTEFVRNFDHGASSKGGKIEATIEVSNLAEWSRIRRKIINSTLVEELTVKNFQAGYAIVNLKYSGTPEQLAASFEEKGLILLSDGTNWKIEDAQDE
ncbi:MAG: hypothetical protein COV36_05645 [Alphaproteobacteria bacterium CG11_big_fil_rev_8_21_14_0_20_44_7]|nr:MAG: hypothetical protein COV36_05645 [Alphaproteobacteria bacterium CG11_big_fil_rev_8_21_14_0_20_44_7]